MAIDKTTVKDLHALYETMGLSSEQFDAGSGFTIHYLQDTFKKLSYTSIGFRPDSKYARICTNSELEEKKEKTNPKNMGLSLYVTRPGLEPRQAEPESAVLPLYYRAMLNHHSLRLSDFEARIS